jgi:hypothetical protein
MTTTQTQQPEAMRLADMLHAESESSIKSVKYSTAKKSAAELRRQHAEIAQLTTENEALKYAHQRDLHAAIRQAAAAEREACAVVCESWNTAMTDKLAAAIRARVAP